MSLHTSERTATLTPLAFQREAVFCRPQRKTDQKEKRDEDDLREQCRQGLDRPGCLCSLDAYHRVATPEPRRQERTGRASARADPHRAGGPRAARISNR